MRRRCRYCRATPETAGEVCNRDGLAGPHSWEDDPVELGPIHPAVIAADYVIAALGPIGAAKTMHALRAGWLTPAEADLLEPLARGIAKLLEVEVPEHRPRRVVA